MASNNTTNTISITGKKFWEKKLIHQIIAKKTNFDPAKSQLHVPNAMVISFMRRIDFDYVFSKLVGKKMPQEVLMLIVNPNNE